MKSTKAQNVKQGIFFLLDVFMRTKMPSFLFSFACMRFVLFMRVKSSLKKKLINRFKNALISSFTTLLTWLLNLPMTSFLYALIFIYDHLWESLLFMRIFLNLFLFMIICDNLSLLWEYFWISSYLWSIILLLIFYHTYPSVRTYSHLLLSFKIYSHLYAFILISMNWKSSWT